MRRTRSSLLETENTVRVHSLFYDSNLKGGTESKYWKL